MGFVQASLIHSESFSLVESASVSRSVFANEGDRLVGNFTVSNIPTWSDAITGNSETVQYAFKVSKIEGLEKCPTDIILYEVYQTEGGSFDVLCEYTGLYRLRFNVGVGAPDLGIGSMRATLSYEVIKNSSGQQENISSPTPTLTSLPNSNTAQNPSPSLPEFPLWTIPFLLILVMTLAGLLVYYKKTQTTRIKHA